MKSIRIISTLAVVVFVSTAFAQFDNRSGWSQSDGSSSGRAGQYGNGTSWWSQGDGRGNSTYSDTSGRSCWTQSSNGNTFTSCN